MVLIPDQYLQLLFPPDHKFVVYDPVDYFLRGMVATP